MDRVPLAADGVAVGTEARLGPQLGKGYAGEAACDQRGAVASLGQAVAAREAAGVTEAVGAVEDVLDVGEVKQQEHLSEERCSSCTRPLRRRMSPYAVVMRQALGALSDQSSGTTGLDGDFVASPFDQQGLTAKAQEAALAVAVLR